LDPLQKSSGIKEPTMVDTTIGLGSHVLEKDKPAHFFSTWLAQALLLLNQYFSLSSEARQQSLNLRKVNHEEKFLRDLEEGGRFNHKAFLAARQALIDLAWSLGNTSKQPFINEINSKKAERLTEGIEWKRKDINNPTSYTNIQRLYNQESSIASDMDKAKKLEQILDKKFDDLRSNLYAFRKEVVAFQNDYTRVWNGISKDTSLLEAHTKLMRVWNDLYTEAKQPNALIPLDEMLDGLKDDLLY
jgi:hypothetical protein